ADLCIATSVPGRDRPSKNRLPRYRRQVLAFGVCSSISRASLLTGTMLRTRRKAYSPGDGICSPAIGGAMAVTAITPEAVDILSLDPQNPRLPEDLQGAAESKILRHLAENDALEEIAQSYVDNGFFPHEPIIILDKPERDGRHLVLEGNRRLAALKIL